MHTTRMLLKVALCASAAALAPALIAPFRPIIQELGVTLD